MWVKRSYQSPPPASSTPRIVLHRAAGGLIDFLYFWRILWVQALCTGARAEARIGLYVSESLVQSCLGSIHRANRHGSNVTAFGSIVLSPTHPADHCPYRGHATGTTNQIPPTQPGEGLSPTLSIQS